MVNDMYRRFAVGGGVDDGATRTSNGDVGAQRDISRLHAHDTLRVESVNGDDSGGESSVAQREVVGDASGGADRVDSAQTLDVPRPSSAHHVTPESGTQTGTRSQPFAGTSAGGSPRVFTFSSTGGRVLEHSTSVDERVLFIPEGSPRAAPFLKSSLSLPLEGADEWEAFEFIAGNTLPQTPFRWFATPARQ